MKRVKAITIKNGEKVYNLASTAADDDWIGSARLLKEGKIERLQRLKDEPMFTGIKAYLHPLKNISRN